MNKPVIKAIVKDMLVKTMTYTGELNTLYFNIMQYDAKLFDIFVREEAVMFLLYLEDIFAMRDIYTRLDNNNPTINDVINHIQNQVVKQQ